MRQSKHERAIRAELEAAEEAYASLAAEVAEKNVQLGEMQSRIALLQRILDAGRTDDKGGEGDG